MNRWSTFVRSKVARRIVLLFFSCALLPVTILAIVSFYEVSSQLRSESLARLASASKNKGMEIYDRLDLLDAELRVVAGSFQNQSSEGADLLQSQFRAISVSDAQGVQHSVWGKPVPFPQLNAVEASHLRDGKTLLRLSTSCGDGQANCVLMIRRISSHRQEESLLIGEVNPDYLWAAKGLEAELQFCVLARDGAILFCSDSKAGGIAGSMTFARRPSGTFEWTRDHSAYDAAYWKLLLRPAFLLDSWTIVVSQERSISTAPMLRFRNSFPLVILLSLWIVLLLSLVQVRRTLGPLEELQKATADIGSGNFDSRVVVSSGDEFQGLAASFNNMAARLGNQFRTVNAINAIDQAIFASLDRKAIVEAALAQFPGLLPGDYLCVCLFDDAEHFAWMRLRESKTGRIHTEKVEIEEAELLRMRDALPAFSVNDVKTAAWLDPMRKLGLRSFFVMPVTVEKCIRAAVVCGSFDLSPPLSECSPEVAQIIEQLAVALSHAGLIEALERQHRGTLRALARAIDAKSDWTAGHSERVTELAVDIARNMKLPERALQIMRIGGLLHDIGKIGTPASVLDKPGKLTPEEVQVMREHVRTGLRILEPIPGLQEAIPIVGQHHEWFNGRGYPEGLAGNQINLYARIFAVADCYDALTSERPYRKAMPEDQALAMIVAGAGLQFDPAVVAVFQRMMSSENGERESASEYAHTV